MNMHEQTIEQRTKTRHGTVKEEILIMYNVKTAPGASLLCKKLPVVHWCLVLCS